MEKFLCTKICGERSLFHDLWITRKSENLKLQGLLSFSSSVLFLEAAAQNYSRK